jgi:hypothetical protein
MPMRTALLLLLSSVAYAQYYPPGGGGSSGGTGNNALCIDATGSTTTYTCPTSVPQVTTRTGIFVVFIPQTTNTGASTLNVAGLGALPLKQADCSTGFASGALLGGKAYAFQAVMEVPTGSAYCLVTAGAAGAALCTGGQFSQGYSAGSTTPSNNCASPSARAGMLWSGSTDPGLPTITAVQSTSQYNNSTLAYGAHVTAGNLLIAVAGAGNAVPGTATDSLGNSWSLVKSQSAGVSFPNYCNIYYSIAAYSGANTVSIGGTIDSLAIAEFSSPNLGSAVDVFGGAANPGPPPTLTSTQANDILISGVVYGSIEVPTVSSPEALLTQIDSISSPARDIAISWVLKSSIGSISSSLASNDSASNSSYVSLAFKTTPVSSFGIEGDWYLNLTTGALWYLGGGGWGLAGWKLTAG